MAKCPRCGYDEITYLKAEIIKTIVGDYDLKEGFDENDPMVQPADEIHFFCPECYEELFINEEDARNFLRS